MILQRRALSGGAGLGLCSDKEIAQSYTVARRGLSLSILRKHQLQAGAAMFACSILEQASAGQSSRRRQPLGGARLSIVHGVKDQFHAAGNAKLFENAEQILLDGVLAKPEFDGDLAIAQSFGHQCHELLLARGEKRMTSGVES